jgi:hypothetical protein
MSRLLLRVAIVAFLLASALWMTRAIARGCLTAPRPVDIVQPNSSF